MNDDVFVYQIDCRDIITKVSRSWEAFARANAWRSECLPEKVVGRLLWDFIQDIETRYLYEELFKKVRTGKPIEPIHFRCDSPQERRFMKFLPTLLPDGQIEITNTIVRTECRDPVRLLDPDIPRSREIIRMCSMCKKIMTRQGLWVAIEEGLAQLKPFETDELPSLNHSVCPDCYKVVMDEQDVLPQSNKAIDSSEK